MTTELTPGDYALLAEARRTNGGGIRLSDFNGKMIGKLMQLGLLVPKKGNVTSVSLYVITRAGRDKLDSRDADERASVAAPMLQNVLDRPPRVVVMSTPKQEDNDWARSFFEQPLAQPWSPTPFPATPDVIDVECREVKDDSPPWGQ